MLTRVDVRQYWDYISSGLNKIKEESNPDWRIEDIYAAVLNNSAELYVDLEESK